MTVYSEENPKSNAMDIFTGKTSSSDGARCGLGKNQFSFLICADTKVTEILQPCQSDKCYLSLYSSEIAGLVCYPQKQINKKGFF